MSSWLKSLSVQDYKGFYEKQNIDFAIPDGTPGSGLTIVLGPNNTGKTSLLELLLKFNGQPIQEAERHGGKKPTVFFLNENGEKAEFKENHQFEFQVNHSNPAMREKIFLPLSGRTGFGSTVNRQMTIDDYINGLKLEHLHANGGSIANVLASLTEDQRHLLDEKAKLFFRDFSQWGRQGDGTNSRIEYRNGLNDPHPFQFLGDGVLSVFKFLFLLQFGQQKHVLVIDEPECYLHPQAQKKLSKLLSDYCKDKQVVMATHSPHFINWLDIKSGAQVHRAKKDQDKCKILRLDKNLQNYQDVLKCEEYKKPQLLALCVKLAETAAPHLISV